MTTRRPLKDGQYSNNDTANLGVPSFAQSVQPYQSEEDSSYPLDRAFTDDSIFSDDSQQQQQGVVMSSNTQDSSNSQDATSPGYTGSSTSKSVRYKSAMTTRARQRRMRRIKERGTADDTPSTSTATTNINSSSTDPPGRVSPSVTSGVLPPPSPSLATTIDSAAVAKAKEHVEQMRLRNSPGGTPTTPTTNLNSSGVGSGVEVGKGGNSPLQCRVYEKHRSRSRSASRKNKSSAPQGEMSSPPLPFPSSGGGNVEKSMLVQTTSAQVKAKMTPEQMASQILAAKKAAADQKAMLSRDSSGGSADPSIPAVVARESHHTRSNTDLASNTSRRKKEAALQAPKPEDYIPDWKTTGSLNPQEVRDAANFTSVQFQCSNVSGEVEMFSDDGEGSDYFSGGEEGDSIFDNEGEKKGVISPTIWETMANPKHATEIENRNREVTSRWQNEVWNSNNNGDATTPSILHSGEIFHQKAAASIVSLLSAERMSGAGLLAPDIGSKEEDEKDVDVEGDSPQGVLDSPTKQHFTFDSDTPGSSRGGEWKGMTQINRTLFRDDLDDDVKQSMIFQAFRQNTIQPSDQLTDLLSQIHRKGNGIDRAFATRRKNACGALKILSAKDENRINLCWTVGVLPAIGSVLSDVNVDIQDDISRAANTEARNRIVSTLLNLSVNKKNRMLIVNTPGVLESMIQTILYDGGEGRQGCCTVLLYLAKTAETRKMIVKSAGMLECLSKVIEVPSEAMVPEMAPKTNKGKKGHDGLQSKRLGGPDDEDALEGMDTFGLKSQKKKSSSQHDSPGKYSISESDATSHTGSHSDDDESQSVGSNEEGKQLEVSFESEASPMNDSDEKIAEDRYDADPNRFLHGARLSVFACLLCLVKSQECAFMIARDQITVDSLSGVAERHLSPSHARAMAILAHLTRHPKNSHHLVFKYKTLLPTLQAACGSPDKEGSRYAFCALQNLSMDKSCRAPLAHSPNIIWSLTQKCKDESDSNDDEARIAAVATLQNLADEPANLIQFTIVKDCIGTIIQIAREDVVKEETTDLTSFMAKNTLATQSHWFRKIAQSGLDRMREVNGHSASAALFDANGVPLKNTTGVSSGIGGSRTHSNLYEARLEPTVFNQWS